MNGENVAVVEGGVVYYVRTDHIGRPVFATDDSGTKVWEASYLPFGGVHTSTGANSNLRFPGQWFQSEAGLHQNWMRDYDPTTGRYIQADPLGLVDGPSIYGYALQNPMRFTDPTGEAIPWGAVIVYSLFVASDILHHEGCLTPVDVICYMLINLDPSKKVKAVRNATRGVRGARSTQKAKKEKDKEDKKKDHTGKPGPEPNYGNAAKHGGKAHNDAIDKYIENLKRDDTVTNIRKNQTQVDVNGVRSGNNRPDVQYDKNNCHHCVEFDHSQKRSDAHRDTIRRNDPNSRVTQKVSTNGRF